MKPTKLQDQFPKTAYYSEEKREAPILFQNQTRSSSALSNQNRRNTNETSMFRNNNDTKTVWVVILSICLSWIALPFLGSKKNKILACIINITISTILLTLLLSLAIINWRAYQIQLHRIRKSGWNQDDIDDELTDNLYATKMISFMYGAFGLFLLIPTIAGMIYMMKLQRSRKKLAMKVSKV